MVNARERSRNRLWRKAVRAVLSAHARRRLYARFDDFMSARIVPTWIVNCFPLSGVVAARHCSLVVRDTRGVTLRCSRRTGRSAGPSISTRQLHGGALRNGT